jgi:hypothetical protein
MRIAGKRSAHRLGLPRISQQDRMSDTIRERARPVHGDWQIQQQPRLRCRKLLEDHAPPPVRQNFFGTGCKRRGRYELEGVHRQHLRHMLERCAEKKNVGQAFRVVRADTLVQLGPVE